MNLRLGGMKQELHDFKNDFSAQLSDLSSSLNEKFNSLHNLLGESEGIIKANINDIVTESLMGVKNSNWSFKTWTIQIQMHSWFPQG